MIKSAFKSVNKMLTPKKYEIGRIYTFTGEAGSHKTHILLSEILNALKMKKKVLYVGIDKPQYIYNTLISYNEKNNFSHRDLENFCIISKNLKILDSYTSVEKLLKTIKSFRPDVIILDEYDQPKYDKDFIKTVESIKFGGVGQIPSAHVIMSDFYNKLRKKSLNDKFVIILGLHSYRNVSNDISVSSYVLYSSDLIVYIDKENGKFKCLKNRYNIPAEYHMGFSSSGAVKDV